MTPLSLMLNGKRNPHVKELRLQSNVNTALATRKPGHDFEYQNVYIMFVTG